MCWHPGRQCEAVSLTGPCQSPGEAGRDEANGATEASLGGETGPMEGAGIPGRALWGLGAGLQGGYRGWGPATRGVIHWGASGFSG